eukprot:gene3915-2783_t
MVVNNGVVGLIFGRLFTLSDNKNNSKRNTTQMQAIHTSTVHYLCLSSSLTLDRFGKRFHQKLLFSVDTTLTNKPAPNHHTNFLFHRTSHSEHHSY